ncbi:hypothetical protein GCM10010149_43450 [Nonomuraea roseoviolacea subsp. roseoviolacea]
MEVTVSSLHPWAKSSGIVISCRHKRDAWLNAARQGRSARGYAPDDQAHKGTFAGEALEDLWI